MTADREPRLDAEQLRRRHALAKLGLAAAVVYAAPIVASVKVYAGNSISPSKHKYSKVPGAGGGEAGAPKAGPGKH
jgi:hypothetical protein